MGLRALSTKIRYALILAVISIVGLYLSITTVLGPNLFLDLLDDFYYPYFSYYITLHGFAGIPLANFVTEYILSIMPAVFYKFFGLSLVTEGLLSMVCLVGTVVCVFLIAKKLSDGFAGIAAAFTLVLMPLIAAEGAASGDNMEVAFFTTLSVLLLLMAVKDRKAAYYPLSGFVAFMGLLAGSALNLLIFTFLVPYLAYLLLRERSRKQLCLTALFFVGIAIGIAVTLSLGYVLQANPLIYFSTNYISIQYQAFINPAFPDVFATLFPQAPAYSSISTAFFWPYLSVPPFIYVNVLGFFGYALLASIIYLAYRNKRNVLFPLAWFAALFLYLGFGKDGLSSTGYLLFAPRFMIILLPPLAIIVGLALSEFVKAQIPWKKARLLKISNTSKVLFAIVALAYLLLATNSVLLMHFLHQANDILTYQRYQTANALLSLPRNSSIWLTSGLIGTPNGLTKQGRLLLGNASNVILDEDFLYWISIEAYAMYDVNVSHSDLFTNCSDIKADYIVGINTPLYKNTLSECSNIKEIFTPSLNASELRYEPLITDGTTITLYKVVR